MAKKVKKVAFLTAGGLAPCLSSSIGFLIDQYTKKAPDVELIGYLDGYMGLLKGESVKVTDDVRKNALKSGYDGLRIGGGDDAPGAQHGGVGHAARDVLAVHAGVYSDGGVEVVGGGVHRLGLTAFPKLGHI